MKKIGLFFISFFSVYSFFGQSDVSIIRYKTSVILSGGALTYRGDVCKSCSNIGFHFSLSSRFQIVGRYFFRPEFSFMRVQAAPDAQSKLSFKNNTVSAILNLEYALNYDRTRTDGRSKNELHLSFAPVLMHHRPFTNINNSKLSLPAINTEGESYSKFILGLKMGLITDFSIAKNKRIGLFADYIFLFSDYVDDVSGNYIDYSKQNPLKSLAIDPTQQAKVGEARGNKSKFDSLIRFGLVYEFSLTKVEKVYQQ